MSSNISDNTQTYSYEKKKKQIWPFVLGGGVVVVAGLVVYLMITRKSSVWTSNATPTYSTSTPSGTINIGSSCRNIADCVSGAYCAQDGLCHAGFGKQVGENCSTNSQCVIGTYCPTTVQMCASGNPGSIGGACNSDSDCTVPHKCNTTTHLCSVTSTSTVTCTQIGVYRMIRSPYNQLKDTTSPSLPSGGQWKFYPSTAPIWYGCSSSQTGSIPLYGWSNPQGDFVWSPSKTTLFTGQSGNNGYTVTNGGNPILHIYSTKTSANQFPVYSLVGHSMDYNMDFHTTAVNTTTISDSSWQGDIVYNSPSGTIYSSEYGTGRLGYVFIP